MKYLLYPGLGSMLSVSMCLRNNTDALVYGLDWMCGSSSIKVPHFFLSSACSCDAPVARLLNCARARAMRIRLGFRRSDVLVLSDDHNHVYVMRRPTLPTTDRRRRCLPYLCPPRRRRDPRTANTGLYCGATGSGWLSMRLNKEPPEDTPVVDFVGLGGTGVGSSASFAPRAGRAGGDAGAGASLPTAPSTVGTDVGGGHEEDEDLQKIKNSGALGEDDNCVVCLSGELRRAGWGGTGRDRGGYVAPSTRVLFLCVSSL